jgi:hypothetical protein
MLMSFLNQDQNRIRNNWHKHLVVKEGKEVRLSTNLEFDLIGEV